MCPIGQPAAHELVWAHRTIGRDGQHRMISSRCPQEQCQTIGVGNKVPAWVSAPFPRPRSLQTGRIDRAQTSTIAKIARHIFAGDCHAGTMETSSILRRPCKFQPAAAMRDRMAPGPASPCCMPFDLRTFGLICKATSKPSP